MAEKKPTHEVVHPRLWLMVDGKMELVPKGSQVYMTEERAKGLGARVCKIGEKPTVDLGGSADGNNNLNRVDTNRIKKAIEAGVKPEMIATALAMGIKPIAIEKALNKDSVTAEDVNTSIADGNDPETGIPVS